MMGPSGSGMRKYVFTLKELDEYVTHDQQVEDSTDGPVVLVNIFHVDPSEIEDLVEKWGDIIRTYKSVPGFISAQFHRGVGGSGTLLNYAVWENIASYRAAYQDPAFREMIAGYPAGAIATPHLFRKEPIANVCVA